MEITRITEKNEAAFEHVLNDTSQKAYPNMVRIGATDDDKNGVAAHCMCSLSIGSRGTARR